jgi:hypothetical protein
MVNPNYHMEELMDSIKISLEQFRDLMLAAGYDHVTERTWEPNTKIDERAHPYDANAIVISGEMILGIKGSQPKKLVTGDTFNIAANTPHYEQYGQNGTTYWVARK